MQECRKAIASLGLIAREHPGIIEHPPVDSVELSRSALMKCVQSVEQGCRESFKGRRSDFPYNQLSPVFNGYSRSMETHHGRSELLL